MGLWQWFLESVVGVEGAPSHDATPKIQKEKLLEVWELAKKQADTERYAKNGWPKTAKVPRLYLTGVASSDYSLRLSLGDSETFGHKHSIHLLEKIGEVEKSIYTLDRWGDEYWYLDPSKVNQLINQLLEEAEAGKIQVTYS